ncbi:MAG: hypothetical protein JRJ34_02085 [Deltaproteobacteria bacterium]|nr:hypothetical protein [Deltaproteobacteria bacterium]
MGAKKYANRVINLKKRTGSTMIKKKVLNPERIRRIDGGFNFIPHRFLFDGFLASLSQKELLLYLFLILASDRNGLSFYSYDSICSLLQITPEQYIQARNGLMDKDLIAFDGTLFQVLDLPPIPVEGLSLKPVRDSNRTEDLSAVSQLLKQTFKDI